MSQKENCFECEGYGYITAGIQCDFCKGKGFILKSNSHHHNKKSKKDEYRSKQREKSKSKWDND